jgi:hypothetical protein
VLRKFVDQYSNDSDEYPKTIRKVTDVLSNHKFDKKPGKDKSRNGKGKGKDGDKSDDRVEASFAQRDKKGKRKVFCYACGEPNHTSDVCTKAKDIPKDKWAITKFEQYMMQGPGRDDMNGSDGESSANDSDDSSVQSSTSQCSSRSSARRSGRSVGFGGFQANFCFKQSEVTDEELSEAEKCFIEKLLKELGYKVLIDTGCASRLVGTIKDAELLEEIRVAPKPMIMATNAGNKVLRLQGKIPGIDEWVWYDQDAIGNVISFNAIVKLGHRIVYDSFVEDAFTVYMPEGPTKFEATPSGLYAYTPSARFLESIHEKKGMIVKPTKRVVKSELKVSESSKCFVQDDIMKA